MTETLNKKDRSSDISGGRSFYKKILVGVVIVLTCLGMLFWYADQLIVSLNPEGGLPKQYFTVEPGELWNIEFKHSYELTQVEEFFQVNGVDDMTMIYTKYKSLGCGLPFSGSEGKLVTEPDGKFKLVMNRPYKTVKIRPAVQARQKVIHNGKVYDLCELYGHGTLIEIKAERRYQYWFN
ncbi:DUF1850 domain-containing protein [uncultured Phascolarctobacterium sp.]|uniref:DUF1850 domain-containing protein n=2 Tax=uncultured Phascolarctobacterium sp. TaxID=512296 RepID=UPI0025F5D79F|nr:DUF1850 domain-containing protein [uncultured Phascolarctobacterium sp.]